jgi:hypothetical protein
VQRRDTYEGLAGGGSRAFELTLAAVVLGGLGWALDSWLGTMPVFTIILFVLAVAGMSISLWYDYDTRMRAMESGAPWAGGGRAGDPATPPEVADGLAEEAAAT